MPQTGALAMPKAAIQTVGVYMESAESRQNLERFRELVLEDAALHDQLRAAADVETFVTLVVQVGRERGCAFTADSVRAALQEQHRAWLERWI